LRGWVARGQSGGERACAQEAYRYLAGVVSAAEIIAIIKKLPPEQKAEVIAFAKSAEAEGQPEERKIRYISKDKFDQIAPQVFERHDELFRRLAE
jgi:hypothetical protein